MGRNGPSYVLGVRHANTHTSITLSRHAAKDTVARVRRGVYRINRFHPELLAMRQGAAGV